MGDFDIRFGTFDLHEAIGAAGEGIAVSIEGTWQDLKGKIIGAKVATATDIFARSEGGWFDWNDLVGAGSSIIGGVIAGGYLGSLGANPYSVTVGGILGGFLGEEGVEKLAEQARNLFDYINDGFTPHSATVQSRDSNNNIITQNHMVVNTRKVNGEHVAEIRTREITVNEEGTVS